MLSGEKGKPVDCLIISTTGTTTHALINVKSIRWQDVSKSGRWSDTASALLVWALLGVSYYLQGQKGRVDHTEYNQRKRKLLYKKKKKKHANLAFKMKSLGIRLHFSSFSMWSTEFDLSSCCCGFSSSCSVFNVALPQSWNPSFHARFRISELDTSNRRIAGSCKRSVHLEVSIKQKGKLGG